MQFRPHLIVLAVGLLLISVSAWQMSTLPLWNYWPLGLFTGILLSVAGGTYKFWISEKELWILSGTTGLLLGLAFGSFIFFWVYFVAFIPLLILSKRVKRIFKYAFFAFLIWNIYSTWWMCNSALIPGIVAIILNSLLMCIPFGLYHRSKEYLPGRLHSAAFILFWMAFEYGHLNWDGSWPWLTLGNNFMNSRLFIQWYDITGVSGGSFWILTINWILSVVYNTRRKLTTVISVAGLLILPLSYSLYKYFGESYSRDKTIAAGVVQPDLEPHYEKFIIDEPAQFERFQSQSDDILNENALDVLFYPETSFSSVDINEWERQYSMNKLKRLQETKDWPCIITGLASFRFLDKDEIDNPYIRWTNDRRGYTYQNSAVIVCNGEKRGQYFKSKLVPGAEIFPYPSLLFFLTPIVDKLGGSTAGLERQSQRVNFEVEGVKIAPIICYESIYGEYVGGYVRRGAGVLSIITNDGWWDNTPGHKQHFALGALRAIEYRRWIARSANTGISGFINEKGLVMSKLSYEVQGALSADIPQITVKTIYARYGDLLYRFSLFGTAFILLIWIIRRITHR